MANDLRFIETLDHSNFDKGIAESTASIKKLSEDANLASKGIKGMFDTPAMKEAAANFQGVEKAVQRFTQAMSRDLPMKQELRQTQTAATELENIWRNLTQAEKQSAAGQEMRQKIDMLIQRGGQLKDTMTDVGNAMKFQSNDTAALSSVVSGVQAVTAAAQVASGAMHMLGMSNDEAAEAQKKLMAAMSIANGLQTIQNALQKESALMMGIAATKTSLMAAATAVKTAATKGDTIATKAAAVAQWAWNAAMAANPIGAAILACAALAAAIYALHGKLTAMTDAQKGAKAAMEQFTAANAQAVQSTAKAALELKHYQIAIDKFNGSAEEEKRLLDEINQKYGDQIGQMNSLADAKKHMAEVSSLYMEMLRAEARASSLAAAYGDTYAKMITGEISVEQGTATMKALDAAFQKNKQLADYISNGLKEVARLQGRVKPTPPKAPPTTPSHPTRAATNTTTTGDPVEKGSYSWYEYEKKKYQELADSTSDYTKRLEYLSKVAELANEQMQKFTPLGEGIKFDSQTLVQHVNDSIGKLSEKIKPMRIPMTYDDGITAAKYKSDALLKQTEGLRLAANAAAGAFRNVGNAIGGMAGQAVNVAGMVAQAIATIITGYAQATLTAAQMGNPWAWVAFALTGLAEVGSIVGSIKGMAKFAQGGIVGGTSYTGDRQLVRVNSGEMILNQAQQARLFSMINEGRQITGNVTFEIAGQKLRGVLNNYDSKMGKVH